CMESVPTVLGHRSDQDQRQHGRGRDHHPAYLSYRGPPDRIAYRRHATPFLLAAAQHGRRPARELLPRAPLGLDTDQLTLQRLRILMFFEGTAPVGARLAVILHRSETPRQANRRRNAFSPPERPD